MSKIAVDVVIEIHFDLKNQANTCIYTNAMPNVIDEILVSWVQDQMGRQVRDESPATERDVYTIKIGVRLEDDAFGHESDTGNHSLTVGIVANILSRLEGGGPQGPQITIRDLSEKPA